jgi:hypothetical protein
MRVGVLLVGLAVCPLVLATDAPPKAPAALSERIAELRPETEAWQQIPWRTDLGEARAQAAEANRPLFVWAMNGNPLGCT